ncbi:MAG: EAL domain-containing protein [Persephonella sp.]|nr:EAL domain-containing protein [Persephonella sp.]
MQEERKVKLNEILKKSAERESFYLVYQPIIEVKTKKIYAVEALLRMRDHNELGRINPDEFIPILEETGMIKQVGYWIIDEVCQQIKKWNKENGVWIPVSINIDIQQLLDENFVESVKEIIVKHDINPRYIKFEITESEAMKFPEIIIEVLKKLKGIGIEISIDDFGTGYSSLSYLKIMPVSYIKIDKSFVQNIPHNKSDNILVMTIVNLAKLFGFKTVAEGVEEKVQFLFLEEIGCDYVQGYYFSRPVPPDRIKEMLTSQA